MKNRCDCDLITILIFFNKKYDFIDVNIKICIELELIF